MITQEQIDQVHEYASLFFSLEEISLLTMIDLEELRREVNFGHSELSNAYWLGKMKTQITLRQKVRDLATGGTLAAEQQLLDWLRDQNESE